LVLKLPEICERPGQLQTIPPVCFWCGNGHMHRDLPGKENASSTPVPQLPARGRRASTSRQLPLL
jgi:hypothetical protein